MGLLDDAIKEHLALKRSRGADAVEISRLESEALGPVARSAEGVPDLPETFEPPPQEPAPGALEIEPAESAVAPAPLEVEQPAPAPPLEADEPAPPPPPPLEASEPPAPPPPPAPLLTDEPPFAPLASPPPLAPLTPPPLSSTSAYEPPPVAPRARDPWMTDEMDPEPDFAHRPEPDTESGGLFSRLRGGRRSKHDRGPQPPPAMPAHDPYEPPPASPASSYQDARSAPVRHEPDIVPADEEPDVEDLLEETPEFLEETPEHDRLWFEQRPPRDFNFDD